MELTNSVSLICKQIYVNSYIRNRYTWKLLTTNPIPQIEKVTQKLDKYVKELLSDNNKISILNQEKTLKEAQEKVVSILGPLTRLWNIM